MSRGGKRDRKDVAGVLWQEYCLGMEKRKCAKLGYTCRGLNKTII